MDVRKLVLLVGALVIAAVTAVMAKNMFTGASAPKAVAKPVAPMGPQVLVATRSLPVGTIIDAEALKYQPWPEKLVQSAYFVKGGKGKDQSGSKASPADLLGTVVRNEITAGQPITQGALIKPGERGFLAAALGPGMRAVTVAVSDTEGVAGFVFPGDRIDIVLTQEVGEEGQSLKVSETILRNVRVLATDQRTSVPRKDGKAVAKNFAMVTLEVTPKITEKIAVAQKIGNLSLALRSIADNSAELERAIASGEVDVPEGTDPAAERRMMLAVASKPSDGATTFTLGGEVSRFERRTLPAPKKEAGADGAVAGGVGESPPRPIGPVVRVARGNNVTVVPVGAR